MSKKDFKLILKAMEIANGNTSHAARILKIPGETLRYKLTKLDLPDKSE